MWVANCCFKSAVCTPVSVSWTKRVNCLMEFFRFIVAHQKERRWNGNTLQRQELSNRQFAIFAMRSGDNFPPNKRSGLFWMSCAVRTASSSCSAGQGLIRTSIIVGRRSFWKLARSALLAMPSLKRAVTRSRIYDVNLVSSKRPWLN